MNSFNLIISIISCIDHILFNCHNIYCITLIPVLFCYLPRPLESCLFVLFPLPVPNRYISHPLFRHLSPPYILIRPVVFLYHPPAVHIRTHNRDNTHRTDEHQQTADPVTMAPLMVANGQWPTAPQDKIGPAGGETTDITTDIRNCGPHAIPRK